jgi:hypothetical protein
MSRETLSQDDVGREVFNEIERNLARLARLFPGICSQMRTQTFEQTLDRILIKTSNGAVLISLDVQGFLVANDVQKARDGLR